MVPMEQKQWNKRKNVTDNRTPRKKNKVKIEEKKEGNLEKIERKENMLSTFRGGAFCGECNNLFSTRDNEFLLVLEELQNANVSNNIDSTTRHCTACTPQTKNSTFGVSAKQKHFFCIS